jgi:hypothetical protein
MLIKPRGMVCHRGPGRTRLLPVAMELYQSIKQC